MELFGVRKDSNQGLVGNFLEHYFDPDYEMELSQGVENSLGQKPKSEGKEEDDQQIIEKSFEYNRYADYEMELSQGGL